MSKPGLVLIVDDDISIRESLDLLMSSEGWRVETFASGSALLERLPAKGPYCVILDISMPEMSGLEVQQRIAVERLDMPIIFITGSGDVPMAVRAMKAGAVELITKPYRDQELVSAVRCAIERSVASQRSQEAIRAVRDCYASLSRREAQVMTLVVAGLLNKQVGGELGISEITVKAHRGNVMRKMKAKSLPDLVRMAMTLFCPPSAQAPETRAQLRYE